LLFNYPYGNKKREACLASIWIVEEFWTTFFYQISTEQDSRNMREQSLVLGQIIYRKCPVSEGPSS